MKMKIIDTSFNTFVDFLKTTFFYKDKVDSLYYASDEKDIIYFKPKTTYTRRDLNKLISDLDEIDAPFMVDELVFATTSNLKRID